MPFGRKASEYNSYIASLTILLERIVIIALLPLMSIQSSVLPIT
jgi:hypothetical protein